MVRAKPNMIDVIPAGKSGNVEIRHFEITEEMARSNVRAFLHPEEYIPPGHYVQLLVNGQIMMSDTTMEWRTNLGIIDNASGHVLIAGLGIGMILGPILANKNVTSVTVIEKSDAVISLVAPAMWKLPGSTKLNIIHADIFTWEPPPGTRWDTIYFDIWPTSTTDNLIEMTRLRRRFARRHAPGAWVGCWKEKHLRRIARRERETEQMSFAAVGGPLPGTLADFRS